MYLSKFFCYVKRKKYSLENELSRLNTSYSFKIARIADFTVSQLVEVENIGKGYDFTNIGSGGQKKDYLEKQQNKMLGKLNSWNKNVKDCYKLKRD
ncbi:hypothetical protein [Liquorilactobacillus satsumensis]|nr:hypothetical protein [Liquorilactobacillus satsumensis]MCC7666657.1 hypothetical protein [Liquorilactobacillus satsumensis]MCP9329214.1 hypothetical protein [Liquorilactobacillus satsumensis]